MIDIDTNENHRGEIFGDSGIATNVYGDGGGFGFGYGCCAGEGEGSGSGDGFGHGDEFGNGDGCFGFGNVTRVLSTKHPLPVTVIWPGYLRVGCRTHTIEEWYAGWHLISIDEWVEVTDDEALGILTWALRESENMLHEWATCHGVK